MSNLVERLRSEALLNRWPSLDEAADEIERLEAENAELREAYIREGCENAELRQALNEIARLGAENAELSEDRDKWREYYFQVSQALSEVDDEEGEA